MNKRKGSILILFLSLSTAFAETKVKRISRTYHNLSEVEPIFMVRGMGTALTLPCVIQEAQPGSDGFKVTYSAANPKRMYIVIESDRTRATNLNVFCARSSLTFDLIPNSEVNQDQVTVVGLFGSPELAEENSFPTERNDKGSPQKQKDSILFRFPVVDRTKEDPRSKAPVESKEVK